MKRTVAMLLACMMMLTGCTSEAGSNAEAPSGSTPETVEPVSRETEAFVWETDAPENHGMDPEILAAMHTALESAPVYAVLTVRDGVIVDEYYREGYDANSIFAFHSATKSVTGALVGIALEEGVFDSVDDPLYEYLPAVLDQADTRKQAITLRHLLTHTSGLEWYEWGGGTSNWEEFRSADNWVDYILNRQLVQEPGSVFNYSTGNTHLLSAALGEALGRSEADYAQEKLFDPLDMESVVWQSDPQGVTDGGNGILMTARDAARFGLLCLNGGEWNGEQIIPANWLEDSVIPKNNGAGDGTGSYGYQWWIRQFGGYDCYYAFGAWGQYILVVPELDLVTVIASEGPQNSYTSRAYFTDYILPACAA